MAVVENSPPAASPAGSRNSSTDGAVVSILAAAGRATLRIVRREPERRLKLLARATHTRQQLVSQGWRIGNSNSQIIPVFIGDPAATLRAAAKLRERGLFVPGIRPPSVPEGESLLRISLSYKHDQAMIDRLLGELAAIYVAT